MSITATAIANLWKTSLEQDARLSQWGQDAYGKPVKILGGASPKSPAREADAPFVVVDALKSHRGTGPELSFELAVDLAVVRGARSVLECKALLEEHFSVIVESILAGASANIDFSTIEDEFEEAYDPLIVLEKTITVVVPNVIGAAVAL